MLPNLLSNVKLFVMPRVVFVRMVKKLKSIVLIQNFYIRRKNQITIVLFTKSMTSKYVLLFFNQMFNNQFECNLYVAK